VAHVERFVEVRARDGLSLSGVEMRPVGPGSACVVWLHGFGVSFDLPQCIEVGRHLGARGVAFVAGNVRGHAGAVTGWRYGAERTDLVRIGSWWEIFEESAMDVAAWMTHAATLGYERLILVGHSFGAHRAIYYLSEPHPVPADGLVLASPSLGLRTLSAEFATLAEQLVTEGRGAELLPDGSWPRGFGTKTVSAQTYASWWRVAPSLFGEDGSRLAGVTSPILISYGTQGDVGGADELAFFAGLAAPDVVPDQVLLDGVTHGYAGGEAILGGAIADWIERTFPN
jgi:pimeloyl-ACP methyl ester carboxylesterase